MSLWDTVCQNVSNVFDSVKEGSKAVKDALIKAKKEADKATIRNVMAPAKIAARDGIKKTFDSEVETIETSTKSSIASIASQLSSAMNGEFSNSVQESINTENEKWGGGFTESYGPGEAGKGNSVANFQKLDEKNR